MSNMVLCHIVCIYVNVRSITWFAILVTAEIGFRRVNRGKKESDEGLYWCVVRNLAGEAVSHNASLNVAGN